MDGSLELERGNDTKKGQPRSQNIINATEKMQRVLVIGDPLLRGPEAPTCHLDKLSREGAAC